MFSKLKRQLPPAGLLAAGLVVITLLTALSGLVNYSYNLAAEPAAKLSVTAGAQKSIPGVAGTNQGLAAAGGPSASGVVTVAGAAAPTGAASRAATGKSSAPSSTSTGGTAANNQPAAFAMPPSTIVVALSVDGSIKGQVQLAAGSNQCDVLTQALAEGAISSLDMQYYPQYGSEAVYVIDGIGDPGTVGWTYTVNGSPPPYGCSLVTAHNGDSVNWQYQ